MKKLIAAADLGVAITLGSLAGAGTANASDSFLNAVHNAGFYNRTGGDSVLMYQGNQVCNWLNLGYSEYSIQRTFYVNTGASVGWADAGQFVAIAEDYLC